VKKIKGSKETTTEAEQKLEAAMNFIASGVDLASRRIEARGEVSDGMACYITRALLKLTEMSDEPIQLYLSSPGGDAYEGLAIYDSIRACPCDVNIIVSGKIMSAAFVILLAGDQRVAAKHTTFMMHSVSYSTEGSAKEHQIQVNEGNRINNIFLDIAVERTKRNKKWWQRAILNHDRYFTMEEAIDIGILTVKPKPKATIPVPIVKKSVKKVIAKKVVKKVRKK
jgi:ATP-dependent Clp protease protease subunit